jgi:hypothetical protein
MSLAKSLASRANRHAHQTIFHSERHGKERKKKLQDPKLGLSGPEKGSSNVFPRPQRD